MTATDSKRPLARTIIVAIVASFLLTACNFGPSLSEGVVVEKIYDDADDWYQPGYTIDGGSACSGGYGSQPYVCVRNPDVFIPGQWHYEPERFLLKLRAPKPGDESKTVTDTISVPENFWNEVRVDQWVDVKTMEIIER